MHAANSQRLLRGQLGSLSELLSEHRYLWQHRPFTNRSVPWADAEPELHAWCLALEPDAVEALEHDAFSRPVHPRFEAMRDAINAACALQELGGADLEIDSRVAWRLPGRKSEQIRHFANALRVGDGGHVVWLDWCAGKGHLTRWLATRYGGDTIRVERSAHVIGVARSLDERCGVHAENLRADVLIDDLGDVGSETSHAVGLHACGELGNQLLRLGVASEIPHLALAPCCHHFLGARRAFEPLSQFGRKHDVGFDRVALRLSIADEQVAPLRDRMARRREMVLRLAWDLLRRRLTGEDRYVSPGNAPRAILRGDVATFCEWAAAHDQLSLASNMDWDALERAATREVELARALALPRSLYRRPLEVWLCIDRALYLAESGYDVRIGTFCEQHVTPRNILMIGERA